jgi:predicted PolB exonuclease-like 3'-5' exonuclease
MPGVSVLCFDIETVPDVGAGRRLLGLTGLDDDAVAAALFQWRRQHNGTEFLPHHLHRVVAISVTLRTRDGFKVWSLGEPAAPEAELVQRFYDGLDRYTPDLVSWNGTSFDLPVLNYRALVHGVAAPRFWETGDNDQAFRWNNYLSRWHWRHTDLMDVLAGWEQRARAPLDHIAQLCGLPGKLGMDGSQVWGAYQAGQLDRIRAYCETDVLNTWLVHLRFEHLRGKLSAAELADEQQLVRDSLRADGRAHLLEYLAAWEGGSGA